MKKFVTVLTAAALTMGVSAASHAADKEVAFSYNPAAPVSAVYTDLRIQANKVCKSELGPLIYYAAGKCINDYVEQIVVKIDRLELTALHNSRVAGEAKIIQLTQLDPKALEKK